MDINDVVTVRINPFRHAVSINGEMVFEVFNRFPDYMDGTSNWDYQLTYNDKDTYETKTSSQQWLKEYLDWWEKEKRDQEVFRDDIVYTPELRDAIEEEIKARNEAIETAKTEIVEEAVSKVDERITVYIEKEVSDRNEAIEEAITQCREHCAEKLQEAIKAEDEKVQDDIKTAIDNAIEQEVLDRNQAITDAIDKEVEDRNSAIEDAIKEEREARIAADEKEVQDRQEAIENAIKQEVSDRDEAISKAIEKEVTDRNTAISTAITQEVSDRDEAIAEAIKDFATHDDVATAVEDLKNDLEDKISDVGNDVLKQAKEYTDDEVAKAITQEVTDRNTAISEAVTNAVIEVKEYTDTVITQEVTDRNKAIADSKTELQEAIDTVQNNLEEEARIRKENDDTEIAARQEADEAESKARQEADTIEQEARIAGDKALEDKFTADLAEETRLREEADTLEATTRETAINTEIQARIAGDNKEAQDRQEAIDALETSLTNQISEEKTARENADQELDNKLAQEILDRTQADETEKTAREAGDKANADGLAQEIIDRTNADELEAQIREEADNEEARIRREADDTLRLDMNTADWDLQNRIRTEREERLTAEEVLKVTVFDAVEGEAQARIAGDEANEQKFNQKIYDEQVARQTNDQLVLNQAKELINNETQARTQAYNDFNNRLNTEESERKTTDDELWNAINKEISDRTTEIGKLDSQLIQETQDRKDSDTELRKAITSESSARSEKDKELEAEIQAEAIARQLADTQETKERKDDIAALKVKDTQLGNAIVMEIQDRELAIEDEKNSRIASDTILQQNIDKEKQDRETAITNEISARESADNELLTKIKAEETARKNADTTITNNLNKEIQDRKNAVTNLENSLQNLDDGVVHLEGDETIDGTKKFIKSTYHFATEFLGGTNHGGYLDFHYAQSTNDYTSRIIENAEGQLNINGVLVKDKVITGSLTGNSDTATKLKNGNTILTDLNSTTAQLFDGSKAIETGIKGVLPIEHGGTGSSTKNFVDLTSNQTIAGDKTFTNQITSNGNFSRAISSTEAGTNPSSIAWGGYWVTDKTGNNNTYHRWGGIETAVETNGDVITYLNVYKNSTGNEHAGLSITYPSTGDPYITGITPSNNADNSTTIPTTSWIRTATGETTLKSTTSGLADRATADSNGNNISSTYATKTEVTQGFNNLKQGMFKIVTSLPTTGEAGIFYLVANNESGTVTDNQNLYAEYIWINSKWELLGKRKLDLSDYTKKGDTIKTISISGTTMTMTYADNTTKTITLTKAMVGLGNVDNTADKDKSVKYATDSNHAVTADTATNALSMTVTAPVDTVTDVINVKTANNDYFKVRTGGSSDNGYAELALGDNGNEPLYVRQYNTKGEVTGEVTLLDANNNSTFSGTITAKSFVGAVTGTASSATILQNARKINGTDFNGSKDITTANWGTARNISISDSSGTNTGTAVSVNGSTAYTLKLPATIKATLTGNADTASNASKLQGYQIGQWNAIAYTGNDGVLETGKIIDFHSSATDTLDYSTRLLLDGTSGLVIQNSSGNIGTLQANLTGNVTGNVSGTASNVTGTVAIANGGTGATTVTGNTGVVHNLFPSSLNNVTSNLYVACLSQNWANTGYLSLEQLKTKLAIGSSDTTGNAASATQLKNTRKIWGQNFNGTADITGKLTITNAALAITVPYTTDSSKTQTNNVLWANSCNDNYGINVGISGGANTVIGGGESANAQMNELNGVSSENLYLTSDNTIYIKVNGQAWANAKTITIDSNANIIGTHGIIHTFSGIEYNIIPSAYSSIVDSVRDINNKELFTTYYVINNLGNRIRYFRTFRQGKTDEYTDLTIVAQNDGSKYSTVNTPIDGNGNILVNDNSSKIATTQWVRSATGNTSLNAATANTATWANNVASLQNATVKKGTNPSATVWLHCWIRYDNAGTAVANRLTEQRSFVEANGRTGFELLAYNYKSGATTGGVLGIYNELNGTTYATAPTPATTDNSTKIATTAFVKAQGYLTAHQSLASYVTTTTFTDTLKSYALSNHTHNNITASLPDQGYNDFLTSTCSDTGKNGMRIRVWNSKNANTLLIEGADETGAYSECLKATNANGTCVLSGPTPATADNSTKIATTAFVKAQGYLTAHQSLADYVTIAGNQTITGTKTFSSKLLVNNVIQTNNTFLKTHTDVTKGTNPSNIKYWTLSFCDKNGGNYSANCLGMFETSLNISGVVSTYMRALSNTANSTSVCAISCNYDTANNTVYTAAPTPATTDNSTKIATTAFVKAQGYLTTHQSLANYVTSTTFTDTLKSYALSNHTHSNITASLADQGYNDFLTSECSDTGKHGMRIRVWNSTNANTLQIEGANEAGTYSTILQATNSNGTTYATAPTPATSDNSTKIATTAFVKAQGYLTTHQSLANYALSNHTHSNYLPLTGGTVTGNLALSTSASNYYLWKRTGATTVGQCYPVLRAEWRNSEDNTNIVANIINIVGTDSTDGYNSPVVIGSTNGTTIIGAGENLTNFAKAQGKYNDETLYLTADGGIQFWTNVANNGTTSTNPVILTNRNLTGLNSVTATTFNGALNGNATSSSGLLSSLPLANCLTYTTGSFLLGDNAGNLYKGSSNNAQLFSAPADGTYFNETSGNIQNLRLTWSNNGKYFTDIFASPNNNYLWHRNVVNGTARTWRRLVEENVSDITAPTWNISISGNAATATSATKATQDSDGNAINSTYVKNTDKLNITAKGDCGWGTATNRTKVITDNTLAYWNGAYNTSNGSNLTYCVKGAFGDVVTHNHSEYALSGHTHSYASSNHTHSNITASLADQGYCDFITSECSDTGKHGMRIRVWNSTNANTLQIEGANEAGTYSTILQATNSNGTTYATAPTPATSDSSTKIATTAFVKAQGYLTAHQSLANYVKLTDNQTITGTKTFNNSTLIRAIELGRTSNNTNDGGYIDFHWKNSSDDYTSRIIESASGILNINGVSISKNDGITGYATTSWVNDLVTKEINKVAESITTLANSLNSLSTTVTNLGNPIVNVVYPKDSQGNTYIGSQLGFIYADGTSQTMMT